MGQGKSQINVQIDNNLYRKVRKRLKEPNRDRIKYGAMTNLITQLLKEWVEE